MNKANGMRISDWSSDVARPSASAADDVAPAIEPTAAMGERAFRRCVACHTIDKGGRNGIGPNLHGIVGRAVAAHDGFSYSGAMKAKGGVWDEAALDAYLADPMKTVPGTRMARSEEHTSELQSLMRISYAVFCLKKKQIEK